MKAKATNDFYLEGKIVNKGKVVEVEKEVFDKFVEKDCLCEHKEEAAKEEKPSKRKAKNRQIKTS